MVKLTNEIVNFAAGNTDHYVAFADYFKHFNKEANNVSYGAYDSAVSLSDKAVKINNSFFAEVERMSGVSRQGVSVEAWASNPQVKWVR